MCARPISSSRALLRACTREPIHLKRLAAGVLIIQWAIDRYMLKEKTDGCLHNARIFHFVGI